MYHTFAYGSYFYVSWRNTYLIRGRGYAEHEIAFLSILSFFVGAGANLLGGFTGDFLIHKIGVKWGRRTVGSLGMGISALCMLAASLTPNRLAAVILLALGAGASDFILRPAGQRAWISAGNMRAWSPPP
jgi:ACS family glucarate transporter-like MFS transporter